MIALLLAWLVAGATLNVAVAWGAVIAFPNRESSAGNKVDVETLARFFGADWDVNREWVDLTGYASVDERYGVTYSKLFYGSGIGYFDEEVRAGFPFTALSSFRREQSTRVRHESGAWHMRIPWGGHSSLPTRLWWPGFAINTLFYAGVLWMLCCGPFALRRMIRRRRGRCPACAYPIGQSPVCTECGAAVVKASRHQGVEASRA